MKTIKRIVSVLILICILSMPLSALALDINASSACVLDYQSGEVLYSKNADVVRAPASLTKVMTLFMLYEGLERGDFTKETMIPISPAVAAASRAWDASNVPLDSNSQYSIEELIEAIVAPSACAASTAFAEFVSGSEEAFAALMTKRAYELGLNLYFEDASGLSDNNTATAASLAELTRLFLSKYPDILNYSAKPYIDFRGERFENTNYMTDPESQYYFPGVDGLKTGSTSLAGKCLIATASDPYSRVISVNMNSKNADYRFSDAATLLRYGLGIALEKNTSVYSTDIKTLIDGKEIECCYFLGSRPALLITAEHLSNYGFDVYYDAKTSTVHLRENTGKAFIPQIMKPKDASGKKLYQLYTESVPSVILHKDGKSFPFKTVYSLNGACLIDVDELAQYYHYTWIGAERTASLSVRKKGSSNSVKTQTSIQTPSTAPIGLEE